MRKRRAIIINNDLHLQNVVARFFAARGYDIVVSGDPSICPVYEDSGDCTGSSSCGDIMLMGFNAPMNGVDLIAEQGKRGCKLPAVNKAIIAGSLPELGQAALASRGVALFKTPLDFNRLERWVSECETRMDLGRPVVVKRREERRKAGNERMYFYMPGNRLARATVVNKSTCGICVATSHHLTTNDMIILRPDSHGASEDAVVRWVRAAGKNRFVVGISYCV